MRLHQLKRSHHNCSPKFPSFPSLSPWRTTQKPGRWKTKCSQLLGAAAGGRGQPGDCSSLNTAAFPRGAGPLPTEAVPQLQGWGDPHLTQ